jgi:hypothetical protein
MKELDKKIARQSQSGSAAMARFVYSIHLFWGGIYFAGCALIGGAAGFPKKRERSERFFGTASVATCIYIREHPALICLKKQFFVECFLA